MSFAHDAAALHNDIPQRSRRCTFTNSAKSDRYLNGIPEDSRVRTDGRFLQESRLSEEVLGKIRALNEIAEGRGQTLAEMALAWLLKEEVITSVLAGASKPSQILYNIKAVENTSFTQDEIETIDRISR